jgi:antitoxin CptB
MNAKNQSAALEHARLKWRSRRGLKELDLLLLPFVEQAYPSLTLHQRETLTEMLEASDPDLYTWLIGYSCPINYEWEKLCEVIRAYHHT